MNHQSKQHILVKRQRYNLWPFIQKINVSVIQVHWSTVQTNKTGAAYWRLSAYFTSDLDFIYRCMWATEICSYSHNEHQHIKDASNWKCSLVSLAAHKAHRVWASCVKNTQKMQKRETKNAVKPLHWWPLFSHLCLFGSYFTRASNRRPPVSNLVTLTAHMLSLPSCGRLLATAHSQSQVWLADMRSPPSNAVAAWHSCGSNPCSRYMYRDRRCSL